MKISTSAGITALAVLMGGLSPLVGAGLHAQTADLVVRVTSGAEYAPVRSVAVAVERSESLLWSGATDASGTVRAEGLLPGTYRLQIDALGFRPHEEEVVLVSGETEIVEIHLEVAPLELLGITVWANRRIQVRAQDTDFLTTVDQRAIELLPVPYDASQIVALTPGARAEHVWGGANLQANSYEIDGLASNHPGLGGSFVQPSTLWIDRVEVRGLGAGAEHGGFQGGQVNVVTKRGTDEFSGTFRSMLSHDALSASNLVLSEIGSEVRSRIDVEGEVQGAVVPDQLFYYASGSWMDRSSQFLNHTSFEERFSPVLEEVKERKVFGKLTWTPGTSDEVNLSAGLIDTRAENYGMTGYEGPGAASQYEAPTWFGTLAWNRSLGRSTVLEAQINHFERDEQATPYQGTGQPGVQLFSLLPPRNTFSNAPLAYRSAPSSTSAMLTSTFRFQTGAQEHLLKVGGEYKRGSFLDRRTRNGGMTWMPVLHPGFDQSDPTTWAHPDEGFTPTQWGGEVDLDADVVNAALFAQGAISLGRVTLTPGIRWGLWTGWMQPNDRPRFEAVRDQGFDPRLGATLDLSDDGTLFVKGHWGRYHQDMITQMFDRAGGSTAFSNEEIWYYHGGPISDPTLSFSEAERDALAEQGLFTRESVVSLNETGPVFNYRQPYIDQWLVGIQKQFGNSVQFEALYTHRSNHNMIALVDRNRETNYTHFRRVRVHMGGPGGGALPFQGGSVYMNDLYIPNNVILDEMRRCAPQPDVCGPPPGLSFADSSSLVWDPDFVLTNAPDAKREFQQVQLTFKFARPRWGGSVSAAFTNLEGNLDDVTGYADPSEFGAGPYVRVNEGVNSYGLLSNFSKGEFKISLWGTLPFNLRGGAFLTERSGDHYSPQFRISGQGSFYGYRANAPAYTTPCNAIYETCEPQTGDPLPISFLTPLEGHEVFVGPRGNPSMPGHATLDLRLERLFSAGQFELGLTLDVFNALGSEAVTQIQTMVNHGEQFYYFFEEKNSPFRQAWAGKWYQSPQQRLDPRSVRLGATIYF